MHEFDVLSPTSNRNNKELFERQTTTSSLNELPDVWAIAKSKKLQSYTVLEVLETYNYSVMHTCLQKNTACQYLGQMKKIMQLHTLTAFVTKTIFTKFECKQACGRKIGYSR